MNNIKLRLKDLQSTGVNTILEFDGEIIHSTPKYFSIAITKNEQLKKIQIGTKFIIGDLFPRVYTVDGINEYPIEYIGADRIRLELKLTMSIADDDFENKLAYNK